ncbi:MULTISPECIES: phosphate/phosphite/phosphonate ABC transporter substrate-binding protein [Halorussus]|uniref:phosphate/phosphite/phosphonate ABC transporter substrate-binding protein n=1 Tax=Halorussus TaxID=1070314 RepID=UPI0020A20196|nr:phosphate/phosphite/phosphonate ABC transporter substrate-binding protein [Halorussus vallis]USZ73860.1 phosphate/phosphite/phosphonate ABC transporter substrate-binding protein [Halorussus vallis]
MENRRTFLKSAAAAGALGLTAGCIGNFSGNQPYGDNKVKFLMSPTEPQDQMRAQYTPIKERFESYLDVKKAEMQYAKDYAATLEALNSGTADVAETGPFAAALGVDSGKAEVILQRHGYGAWTYSSVIVTRKGSDISKLTDLKGKKIAFADPLSASGSLYPLGMLKKAGLSIPDEPGSPKGADFEPSWSGHFEALQALKSEQVDAAGVGYFITLNDDREYKDFVKEVARDKGIPRAPILVSPTLSDEEKTKITEAFTKADKSLYLGKDGKADTDEKSDDPDDDLWFDDVRKADAKTYDPVVQVANELGYGQDIFSSGTTTGE